MTYSVIYTARARKNLKHLPPDIAKNCIRGISRIKEDPFSFVKKLKGPKKSPLYSLKIGEHRAILSIEDDRLIILVLEIGHRRNIYRKY